MRKTMIFLVVLSLTITLLTASPTPARANHWGFFWPGFAVGVGAGPFFYPPSYYYPPAYGHYGGYYGGYPRGYYGGYQGEGNYGGGYQGEGNYGGGYQRENPPGGYRR